MTNTIYCTYLTVYSGNKLPPLYIGSTSIKNIEEGYHGSVTSKKYKEIWTTELKENPHLFETQILTTHSTREEAFEEEVRYQLEHNVVRSPLYMNMAYANKKFICESHTDETKKIISEAVKKRFQSPEERLKSSEIMKKRYQSEEARKITSYAMKGVKFPSRSEEHRRKLSESNRNRRWFHNPATLENIMCLPENKPENYIPGMRRKIKN